MLKGYPSDNEEQEKKENFSFHFYLLLFLLSRQILTPFKCSSPFDEQF